MKALMLSQVEALHQVQSFSGLQVALGGARVAGRPRTSVQLNEITACTKALEALALVIGTEGDVLGAVCALAQAESGQADVRRAVGGGFAPFATRIGTMLFGHFSHALDLTSEAANAKAFVRDLDPKAEVYARPGRALSPWGARLGGWPPSNTLLVKIESEGWLLLRKELENV